MKLNKPIILILAAIIVISLIIITSLYVANEYMKYPYTEELIK